MANEYSVYDTKIELVPAGVYVADGTGTPFDLNGKFIPYMVVCEYTNKATDASDTMDVYVDFLVGATWINAARFTTALGNGTDAQIEVAFLGPYTAGATVVNVAADVASGVVRPGMVGQKIRARWDFTDGGGGGAATFTFGVTAYCL